MENKMNMPNQFNDQKSEHISIRLTPSVETAASKLKESKAVSSRQFAFEIMKLHPEYGNKISASIISDYSTVKTVKNAPGLGLKHRYKELHVTEWITLVSEIYNHDVVKEFNGRLFIIGLNLLDEELHFFFQYFRFIEAIQAELKEELVDILSDKGLQLYYDIQPEQRQHISMSDYEKSKNERIEITDTNQTMYDDVKNQTDNPVRDMKGDKLDRYRFAEYLVSLLNNIEYETGSFSFHIYGTWGAGKSSVLNFMKTILEQKENDNKNSDANNWIVVEFNAWQHQNLKYPWWTLLDIIYNKVKHRLSYRTRFREWLWRFSSLGLNHYLALIIAILITAFFTIPIFSPGSIKLFDENIIKLVAGILTIGGIIIGAFRYSLFGSEKAAEYYIESTQDPMNKFKNRFNKFIKDCAPDRVVIIVDDLDRCKSSFVVELLENIQTLFKKARVVFIISADKKWINASYEIEYDKIKNFIGEKGKSLGALFTEKMFQISVSLPGVIDSIRKSYWSSILGTEAPKKETLEPEVIKEIDKAVKDDQIKNLLSKTSGMSFEKDHAIRLEIVKKLGDKKIYNKTEHKLIEYYKFLDNNPRSMKRLVNCFSINRVSALLSHIDIDHHQLILWTILAIRWPVIGEFLIRNPGTLNRALNNANVELPSEIKELYKDDDVMNVLNGNDKGKLDSLSIEKCEYFI